MSVSRKLQQKLHSLKVLAHRRKMSGALQSITVPSKEMPCKAVLVWLHGFGDEPEGWASELRALSAQHVHLKRVHLRAPLLPQTCYGGSKVPGWGNYKDQACTRVGSTDYDNQDIVSEQVLEKAQSIIQDIVDVDGVPPEQVIIGGFSMGATAAAEIALRFPKRLGALIMLNGWLLPGARAALKAGGVEGLPVLVSHGSADEQVGFDCGEEAAKCFKDAGVDLQFEVQNGMTHVSSGFGVGKDLAIRFATGIIQAQIPRDE